ncbi:hypothetical protein ACLN6N_14145 [Sphingomonas carotinifaciens]|uniref:hypothetical protein n=2 Tax=Sphingomonadaceae TaxID=41297 RepID=UPI000DD502D5|nr:MULTISPECIES: hypothetical protein [Sphingomonas]
MKMTVLLALLAASPALTAPVMAQAPDQRRGDQMKALQARKQGRILPMPEIEKRVLPQMEGAQYLGFDFDASAAIYTMKFLRNGTVIWVEVDARSGQIVGRTDR